MSEFFGEDRQAFQKALLDAFTDIRDLKDLYENIFQEDPGQRISANSSGKDVVDYIIGRSAERDLLKELVDTACQINPTNKKLQKLKKTKTYQSSLGNAKIYPAPDSKTPSHPHEESADHPDTEDLFIKFVNREKELARIFLSQQQNSRNWIIDGPPGYGKTKLLNELDRRYKSEHWITIRVSLPRSLNASIDSDRLILNRIATPIFAALRQSMPTSLMDDASMQMDEIGMEIASAILEKVEKAKNENPDEAGNETLGAPLYTDHPGVAIMIDNIEALPDDCVSSFLSLLEGIFTGLQNAGSYFSQGRQLRIFVAGRYARNKIKRVSSTFAFVPISLEPFTFEVVSDTVREYATQERKNVEVRHISNIAAQMMYLTGGHPGFMARLLEVVIKENFVKGALTLTRRANIYQTEFTGSFYGTLLGESPRLGRENLVGILATLSPYRRYDRWFFLKELKKHALLPEIIDEEALEKELLSAYLVDRQSGFLHDGIYRFLLEIWLRLNHPDDYKARVEAGIAIYEAQLDLPKNFRQVETLAVELLYIKMANNYYVKGLQGEALIQATSQDLENVIMKIIEKAQSLQEQDIEAMKEAFIDCLRKDIEFRFLYNFFTKGENFDEQHYEAFISQAESLIGI